MLKAAEDSLAGLHGSLHVPVIKPPRGRIPGSRTRLSPLESAGLSGIGHFFSRAIISGGGDLFGGGGISDIFASGDLTGNFEQSAGQFAGKLFDTYMRGQRIQVTYMAFDEIEIPLHVSFGSSGGPGFSTEVVVIDSGYERRNQNWSQARRSFDAKTGVRSAADVGTLLAFFHARAGRARGFRLKDWSDFTSNADGISTPAFNDQTIATGDGSTLTFQLVKNYTSDAVTHQRIITKPVSGSMLIGVNGTQVLTGWSVDTTTGLVTFASAPPASQAVTAGYQFDVPVRFDTDQLSLTAQNFRMYRADIPIVEVRDLGCSGVGVQELFPPNPCPPNPEP